LTQVGLGGSYQITHRLWGRIQWAGAVDIAGGARALIGRTQRADDAAVFSAHPVEKALAGRRSRIKKGSLGGRAQRRGSRRIVRGVAKDAIKRRAAYGVPT